MSQEIDYKALAAFYKGALLSIETSAAHITTARETLGAIAKNALDQEPPMYER